MKELVGSVFLGMPLVAWGGVITFMVLVLQILIGNKILRVDFKYHKVVAYILLVLAAFHGIGALIYIFG